MTAIDKLFQSMIKCFSTEDPWEISLKFEKLTEQQQIACISVCLVIATTRKDITSQLLDRMLNPETQRHDC